MDWFNKRKALQQAMKDKSKNIARITGIVDGDSFTASVKGEEKTICLANVDPSEMRVAERRAFLRHCSKSDSASTFRSLVRTTMVRRLPTSTKDEREKILR